MTTEKPKSKAKVVPFRTTTGDGRSRSTSDATATGLIIRAFLRARRALVRRSTRDPSDAAERFVIAGRALNQDQLPDPEDRAELAGLKPGMVTNPDASVLDIWLAARRWRDRLPIDDLVDSAIAELDARRRALH